MLIICSEEEKQLIRKACDGSCIRGGSCIFLNVRCPIEHNMIITDKEVANGKSLEVKMR